MMKRLLAFVAVLVAALALAGAAAANVNWYSSPSIGAGYLQQSGHVVNASIVGNGARQHPDADQCAYYGPTNLNSPISWNPGGVTGFTTPQPLDSYQEGSVQGYPSSVCQAAGSTWGFFLYPVAAADCNFCGMNHGIWWSTYTRYPWGTGLSNPSLQLSANFTAGLRSSSSNWHGYMCAQLLDTTTYQSMLYCLQPWSTNGQSESQPYDSTVNGEFGTFGGVDTWSYFSQTPKVFSATEGYSQTSQGTGTIGVPPGGNLYAGEITQVNLINALYYANLAIQTDVVNKYKIYYSGGGTSHMVPYSLDPTKYVLVGLVCGLEGGGTSPAWIGGSCANFSSTTVTR